MTKNVLILTVDCWNLNIAANSSYTYSNLFSSLDEYVLSNIYIRDELPNDPCCSRYFQISENKILKSVLNRKIQTGREVECGEAPTANDCSAVDQQKNIYANQSQRFINIKKIAREIIWKIAPWRSPALDQFLDSVKPDVVIFSMEGYIHFNRICCYVLQKTGAKGIGYFWDDNFTYKQRSHNLGYKFRRFFQRRSLKKLAQNTDSFWAISPKTKKEADQFFGIDCIVLPKSAERNERIDFENEPSVTLPIKMMYAGNLMIGRMDTIRIIANALSNINKETIKICLDIYTTTAVPDDLQNFGYGLSFHEPISQNEVLNLQQQADVLLFVEDIIGKERKIARLSFSTKIPDYLSSGKCVFAIGDYDTAPMEYFNEEQVALCADNAEEIQKKIEMMLRNPSILKEYGMRAAMCAQKNHSKKTIQLQIKDTINEVLSR